MNGPTGRAFQRRALRPTLFSATLHPEFIPALVLANLMTPRLWDWADKVTGEPSWAGAGEEERLALIHRFLNRRFCHPDGTQFGRIWGLQERERIGDPEERLASDYAMEMISRSLAGVSDPSYWTFSFLPSLRNGQFPLYVYPTVDVVAALAAVMPGADRRVLGVTSCLDECVLAASLALATGACGREDFAFFGSPAHYTMLIRTGKGPVWFNAKRECFSCAAWAEAAGSDPPGAFLQRMFLFDRLITATAWAIFPQGPRHDPGGVIDGWVGEAERFVGGPVPWLHPVPEPGTRAGTFTGFPRIEPGQRASGAESAVLAAARAEDAGVAKAALLAFRHREFCSGELLEEEATNGFRVFVRAAEVFCPDDADALVAAIPGTRSIYGETGRMALPDEVLAFQTGSEAERNLLRRTLVRLAPPWARARWSNEERGSDVG